MATDTRTLQKTMSIGQILRQGDVALAIAVIGVVAMMVIPLPSFLLDLLLTLNIAIAITILLIAMYVQEPLQFSVFPSLLLIVTLFRLGLNVSSSRLILLQADAGKVIDAFGQFVVGGNYVVGIVVFLLLMVIQFVVITNGSGRVAEVAARFTLDAMPGKQMSIDAELNAGLIDDDQARRRRRVVEMEADFYGAMDGASKFVKGDAIAAVAIVLVNILGGFVIGAMQLGLSLTDALKTYTLLTVGDGLVSQIPALLISTATGIIVTRAASEASLGQDIIRQTFSNYRAPTIVAAMLLLLGLIPGLPKAPFLSMAALFGSIAYVQRRAQSKEVDETTATPAQPQVEQQEDMTALLRVDPVEVELGYGLIPLVDEEKGGNLLERVGMIRRQLAGELGFILPKVRIRDNLHLPPNTYTIKLRGEQVATGELRVNHLLAMAGPGVAEDIQGIDATEPVFGMPARWIPPDQKERAEVMGFTVVDASSIVTTHLTETMKTHAASLLGRQEVHTLLENLRSDYPVLINETNTEVLTLATIQQVLQNLLRERVPVRDLITILEVVTTKSRESKDADVLSEAVRQALGRAICNQYKAEDDALHVITLGPSLEQLMSQAIQPTEQGVMVNMDPSLAQYTLQQLGEQMEQVAGKGYQPVLLASARIRPALRRFIQRTLSHLAVLSFSEVPSELNVLAEGMVELESSLGAGA